jgi:hypothetical protein
VLALVLGVAGGTIAILLATTFHWSSIYLIRDFLPEFRSLIEPASECREPFWRGLIDGVDAPPDGIAMCQGGDVCASHE